eukprot:TRINITY_DN7996_c0_g1_i1.p1 TRINITY_DN7996_c0_g1~~TRINITY_DN7996_c0_g1_i1.p1  ORF type:complete len:602 (+),score=128.80 TRINITY_DN7996_c0_g1_i1:239-1807(+)
MEHFNALVWVRDGSKELPGGDVDVEELRWRFGRAAEATVLVLTHADQVKEGRDQTEEKLKRTSAGRRILKFCQGGLLWTGLALETDEFFAEIPKHRKAFFSKLAHFAQKPLPISLLSDDLEESLRYDMDTDQEDDPPQHLPIPPSRSPVGLASAKELAQIPPLIKKIFGDPESRVNEFFEIWSKQFAKIDEKDYRIYLALSYQMDWLRWVVLAEKACLKQEMIDFFWNVGAPQPEIDKLEDLLSALRPPLVGSWIDISSSGGMDGGWFFPVSQVFKHTKKAVDEGEYQIKIDQFLKDRRDVQYVGRDMGASPPRQAEFRYGWIDNPYQLNCYQGSEGVPSFEVQLEEVFKICKYFKIPAFPKCFIKLLKKRKLGPLQISIVVVSDTWVKFGLLISKPTENDLVAFAKIMNESPEDIINFMRESKVEAYGIELYYLNQSFGYGVYKEGWNFAVHFNVWKRGLSYYYNCAIAWPKSHQLLSKYERSLIEVCFMMRWKTESSFNSLPQDLLETITRWIIRILPTP